MALTSPIRHLVVSARSLVPMVRLEQASILHSSRKCRKTGGFEPQYGQSEGGIIQIVTQSGGNQLHGALYGYARPDAFEAKRKQRDDFAVNKAGEILASEK